METSKKHDLELFPHNRKAYENVKKAFESGEDVVGIVHATGTGKSFIALNLAKENKDKKIIFVVPYKSIIEHIKKIIKETSLEKDFSHVEFRTYGSFINLSRKELEDLDIDMLILDEFHHLGAPVWGPRIEEIIETHPKLKVFGMTAYTVRDRDNEYERDMAEPDGDELFSDKIVSNYDLCDAIIDGILPKPIYKTAYNRLTETEEKIEEIIETKKISEDEKKKIVKLLEEIKRKIANAKNIGDVVKSNIKPDGKYIYFCPPFSKEGENDIETIKTEAYEWFKEITNEKDIVIYTSTSDMKNEGIKNREAFYKDETIYGEDVRGKLRIMFAINQYNEGVHAPNIDGVIMGRGTRSDIVFFEQLGRALSVYKSKNDTQNKSPIIIDLTNNIDYIKELENKLKNRIREIKKLPEEKRKERNIAIKDATFNIEVENVEIFEALKYLRDRLCFTWEDYCKLLNNYIRKYGHSIVPKNFKTLNGTEYDENGINLGIWVLNQIQSYKNGRLETKRINSLIKIGFKFENTKDLIWKENYGQIIKYYKKNKTLDGLSNLKSKTNKNLEQWLLTQIKKYKNNTLKAERRKLIEILVPLYEIKSEKRWNSTYQEIKSYYEKNNNSLTGLGKYKQYLSHWIYSQKNRFEKGTLDLEKVRMLQELGITFRKQVEINGEIWNKNYNRIKEYYKKFNVLNNLPEELKDWIDRQKIKYKEGKLTNEQKEKLEKSGVIFENVFEVNWNENYQKLAIYIKNHKNIENLQHHDKNLYKWLTLQKTNYRKGTLNKEREQHLIELGITFDKQNEIVWETTYEELKKYFDIHGTVKDINTKGKYITSYSRWIEMQITKYNKGNLEDEKYQKLLRIGINFNAYETKWESKFQAMKQYFIEHGNYNSLYNNYSLYSWFSQQRRKFENGKLTNEQIQKLESIGIILSISNNTDEIREICELHQIDYELNKKVLNKMSSTEMKCKINFLIKNSMLLTDSKGKLHEIFSMSNLNMKVKYGLSYEDIITTYKEKEQEIN